MEWDVIVDIPFPVVTPEATTEEVQKIADKYFLQILEKQESNPSASASVMPQGEFALCYLLFEKLHRVFPIAVPTTQRVVEEKLDANGNVNKVSIFKFVGWRIIPPRITFIGRAI